MIALRIFEHVLQAGRGTGYSEGMTQARIFTGSNWSDLLAPVVGAVPPRPLGRQRHPTSLAAHNPRVGETRFSIGCHLYNWAS
jgi:hypothetical protein